MVSLKKYKINLWITEIFVGLSKDDYTLGRTLVAAKAY